MEFRIDLIARFIERDMCPDDGKSVVVSLPCRVVFDGHFNISNIGAVLPINYERISRAARAALKLSDRECVTSSAGDFPFV
jgi:hypothetical protein